MIVVTFRLSALGYGGTERVFLSVADYLSSTYGWSVDFVVDKSSNHETEQIAIAKGYRVVSLDMPRTWKTILPFAKYLKQRSPSIVISAYTETNAAALLSNALNRFRTRMIVTEHVSLDEHWADRPRLRKLMLAFIVSYVYKLADHVLCVSRGVAEQLDKRLSHPRITFIHNPVRFALRTRSKTEAKQMLGIRQDEKMILAVGRISKQKNYLMLLQAFESLVSKNALNLYIVGGIYERDEKLRLDQFIVDYGLDDRVHFIDFTHEIQAYYEASDLLVLSSAWEGFGNVLVEALAFGLPIVSTRCNFGPAEILADGQYGALVDVNDHLAMGQAIQRVLTQNNFAPERQLQRAQAFTEQRIGEAYYQLICQTMSSAA